MMPTIDEIARQVTVLAKIHKFKTTKEIADMLAYPPLFTINGIARAVELGYITENKEKNKLTVSVGVMPLNVKNPYGEVNERIVSEIIEAIGRANDQEQDQSVDQLKFWLLGLPPSALDIALHDLLSDADYIKYTLEDPQDPESKYDFLTHAENKGKDWGYKQFKTLEKK